jgi:hypothetical protein
VLVATLTEPSQEKAGGGLPEGNHRHRAAQGCSESRTHIEPLPRQRELQMEGVFSLDPHPSLGRWSAQACADSEWSGMEFRVKATMNKHLFAYHLDR